MTFDTFVDWYGTWGLRAAGFVVGTYIAFVATVIFRYFQGVWRGKWPLENCVGIGIGGIGKSIFLGGFCFLVIGGIAFIGWPIVIPLSVVVVLHPDFRKNCASRLISATVLTRPPSFVGPTSLEADSETLEALSAQNV